MHFSKEFSRLLLTLPPTLTANAVQYRKLKKLINEVVLELALLGLDPAVIQVLLQQDITGSPCQCKPPESTLRPLKLVYEFINDGTLGQPLLRFSVEPIDYLHVDTSSIASGTSEGNPDEAGSGTPGPSDVSNISASGLRSMLRLPLPVGTVNRVHGQDLLAMGVVEAEHNETKGARDVVVTLASDTSFYQSLSAALESLSAHLVVIKSEFLETLQSLSQDVALTARPVSSVSSFQPQSALSDPKHVHVQTFPRFTSRGGSSDLYNWRELFQLYVDIGPFESVTERNPGERTPEDCEKRLALFSDRITKMEIDRKFKLKQSLDGLRTFLQLNMFVLNLKKFQYANAEAVRKILKKHAKRTSLPMPAAWFAPASSTYTLPPGSSLVPTSLPRTLVQAIGEVLLAVVPHIDDYACLICTSLAFKPVRLTCGHLFCVRCLVKMQRRGQDHCPLCRAPTVLVANRLNVDWALMNFMKDWFPLEAKAKLRQNEREMAEEEIRAMGFDPGGCKVM